MTTRPADLVSVLDAADQRWRRHLSVLEHDQDFRLRGPDDPWLPRDEYAHHWRWIERALAASRFRVEKLPRPDPIADVDATNDAWAAEDAALSHEEARERCTSVRAAYIDYVSALSEEQRDHRIMQWFRQTMVAHFDEHVGFMVRGITRREGRLWDRITTVLNARADQVLYLGDDGREWQASEVYAHLARWMEITHHRIVQWIATGAITPAEATPDELNARWLAEDEGMSLPQARDHATEWRRRFIAQIEGIPNDRWTPAVIALVVGNTWGHYQEHLDYMRDLSEELPDA